MGITFSKKPKPSISKITPLPVKEISKTPSQKPIPIEEFKNKSPFESLIGNTEKPKENIENVQEEEKEGKKNEENKKKINKVSLLEIFTIKLS